MAVWANGNESWVLSKATGCFNSSALIGRLLKMLHKDLQKLIHVCHPFWPLLWIKHAAGEKPATLKSVNKTGVVSGAAENQLFTHTLIFMQTCPDTFIGSWATKAPFVAAAAASLQLFSKCLITENTSFHVAAATAYQHFLLAVTSTQLANLQSHNLSDVIYFILFQLKVCNLLCNTVLILRLGHYIYMYHIFIYSSHY